MQLFINFRFCFVLMQACVYFAVCGQFAVRFSLTGAITSEKLRPRTAFSVFDVVKLGHYCRSSHFKVDIIRNYSRARCAHSSQQANQDDCVFFLQQRCAEVTINIYFIFSIDNMCLCIYLYINIVLKCVINTDFDFRPSLRWQFACTIANICWNQSSQSPGCLL